MKALLVFVLVFFSLNTIAADFPKTINLQEDGSTAANQKKILVLYISMPGCPYCQKLEEDILTRAYQNNELSDVRFLEFEWVDQQVTDFEGNKVSAEGFLKQYGVVVTPTMLFLGESGEELANRLIGYKSEDFYWRYFRKSIDGAKEWVDGD